MESPSKWRSIVSPVLRQSPPTSAGTVSQSSSSRMIATLPQSFAVIVQPVSLCRSIPMASTLTSWKLRLTFSPLWSCAVMSRLRWIVCRLPLVSGLIVTPWPLSIS